MAYLTCPWCHTPQLVGDESPEYQCFTCYGEVRFFPCPHCSFVQTVSKRWSAFTCGKCDRKVDLPHRWGYTTGSVARTVRGTGNPYPKL